MKNGFISSGYPEHIVSSIIVPILKNAESGQNKYTDSQNKMTKDDLEFLLQIPYINDTFTRVTKSNVKRLGLNAKVIIKSKLSNSSILANYTFITPKT